MNKKEVIEFLKSKSKDGYIIVPYILQTYKDEEEIPEYLIKLIHEGPKEDDVVICYWENKITNE